MTVALNTAADSLAEHFLGILPLRPSEGLTPDYVSAFRAWENLLGSEHVRCDDSTRGDYSRTTLPVGTRPAGVIRPHTTAEVCEVARIARQCRVPLHAISRGKNWGYGDACAPDNGYVIVELTRMKCIREVNVELGYAVIEPGVSQGQMYEYLRDNNLPLLLDVTGAGPDASIVGNILQRGFGHTPYGDRFRHTSGFEVVLPDGRLINTGFGQFENAKAAQVFPWGVGPWIDGLFTQSHYGIVTSACVWLMPRPEVIEGFAIKIDGERNLEFLIDQLRQLRMAGTVRSTVHIANDLRVLSSRLQCPWHKRGSILSAQILRAQLRRKHGLGTWNVLGGLYGTRFEVRAAKHVIRRELKRISGVRFFDRPKLTRIQRLLSGFKWLPSARHLGSALESATGAFDLLEGIPNSCHLRGAHWCSNNLNPTELRDPANAGLIWISPVFPMVGKTVVKTLAELNEIMARHDIDPLYSLTTVTDRAICCVISINYDRSDPGDGERAKACEQAVSSHLHAGGFYAYRSAIVSKTTCANETGRRSTTAAGR